MPKAAVLAAALLVALAAPAAAQPGQVPPGYAPLAPPPGPVEGELGEGTALALSLGATVGSYGLLLASAHADDGGDGLATLGALGTVLAPSAGHWYAGAFFTRGLGLRLGGMTAVFSGALLAFAECPLFSGEECRESPAGLGLMIVGSGLWIGGTIDDIVTAPGRVREHNARLRGLAVAPMVQGGGGGVMVAGSF